MVDIRHRHQDAQKRWTGYYTENTDTSFYATKDALEALAARVSALEPPVEPPAEPGPLPGARVFKPGTYAGTYRIDANEEWVFEPGAILTGTIRWAAPGAILRNLTARDAHETQVVLEPSAGGKILGGLIENTGTPANGKGYSTISANDKGAGVGTFAPLLIKGVTFDQRTFDWFGVEVWGVRDLVIEDCTFKGEGVHISIPRSDGAIVRNNTFDLTQTVWTAIELSDVENVIVEGNTATGNNPMPSAMWRAFVQLHPGSGAVRNVTIRRNRLSNFPALVNAAGDGHHITDNCLVNVSRVQWGDFAGPVELARNAPC